MLSAWIKILGPPTNDQGNIIVKPGSYYLVYRDGKLGMYLYGPSDDGKLGYKTGKTELPLRKWMHVALTYNRKKLFLYLLGKCLGCFFFWANVILKLMIIQHLF